jgi:hypothetical protein
MVNTDRVKYEDEDEDEYPDEDDEEDGEEDVPDTDEFALGYAS